MNFSAEYTFVPRLPPYEILNKEAGKKLVEKLNEDLYFSCYKKGIFITAKLDPFHHPFDEARQTFCVEICPMPGFPWSTTWLDEKDKDYKLFKSGISNIFSTCRKFGLVPCPIKKSGNKEVHFPTGGCHLHFANEFYSGSADYYKKLENFHKNLVADYTNKPFIRWFLSQWFDNSNSGVIYDKQGVKDAETRGKPITRDEAFEDSLNCRFAIEPRFMLNGKNTYNTFEFRFINMVEDFNQFKTVVKVMEAWISYIRISSAGGKELPITIKSSHYSRLFNNLQKAKKLCQNWIDEIGLTWDDEHEKLWNKNYRNRILKGELL